MADTLKIKIIIGTTRPNRFSEKPAHWIFDELKKHEGVEAELLDLRDYPMPFFNEAASPSYKKEPYADKAVAAWTKKIAEADGFIVVTGEYNHGDPAVLKNAIDYVGSEGNMKAMGFVSYGSVLGARAMEQLRQIAVELQVAPIRAAVHIPSAVYMAAVNEQTPVKPELFEPVQKAADAMIDQLLWWTKALKVARAAKA